MKCLIFNICMITLLFSGNVYAQDIDAYAVLKKSNGMIMNIYNSIFEIRGKYDELKNFGKESLRGGKFLSIYYGSPVKRTAGKGDIWISISFSETSYDYRFDEFKSEDFYIEEIALYLRCNIWAEPSLKENLLKIVKENILASK